MSIGLTPGDIDIAARTIAREAGNQGRQGMTAVAEVLINRMKRAHAFNKGKASFSDHCIAEVCLRPYQFSCWNVNDPNRAKALAMPIDDPWYKQARDAFIAAWQSAEDITNGATHYHTVRAPKGYETRWPPSWAPTMRQTVTIGAHVFYKPR